jgi:hypothetical protein
MATPAPMTPEPAPVPSWTPPSSNVGGCGSGGS